MAEQKLLKLTISRVDGPIFGGEAASVTVPGTEGEMTILPHHTAIISPLKKGTITVKSEGGESSFEVEGGTLEMSDNVLTILV